MNKCKANSKHYFCTDITGSRSSTGYPPAEALAIPAAGREQLQSLMKHFVYILKSETTSKFYVGISTDPSRRLLEHNSGKTKTTKSKGPWRIVFQEEHSSRMESRKREIFFKSGLGRQFIKSKFS